MSSRTNVLVVDDHPIILSGLRQLFADEPTLHIIGEATDGEEALQQVELLQPDVVIIDLFMPILGGFEVIQHLQNRHPHIGILVLTAYTKPAYAVRALQQGALGYLVKQYPIQEIIPGVKAVAKGQRYISSQLANAFIDALLDAACQNEEADPYHTLTPQEQTIFRHIVAGTTSRQIGEQLHLNVRTVEGKRGQVMKKLGLHSLAEAMQYAYQHGILLLDTERI